jgi:hypothetical protein
MRQSQNFANGFRDVAEFEISVCLAGAGQAANHSSEAATVDKSDLTQVQNYGATVAQQPRDVCAERIALAACRYAAIAANNSYMPNFTGVERQAQNGLQRESEPNRKN